MKLINRFALYGFLKELKFFEPIIILFFLHKGLSFFEIGILYGFKAICVNIFEIPSGAVADIYGRKSAMIFSLSSYIAAFIVFALSNSFVVLLFAMLSFSLGDAFRTGTHKAIIFSHLQKEDKLAEKTKVYGFTRSWSKKGGALSAIISALIVIVSGSYEWVFWVSIIPYIIGIWNIASYPTYLNMKQKDRFKPKKVLKFLIDTFKESFRNKDLRKLIIKGFTFTSQFESTKAYLQVLIKVQVLTLPVFLAFNDKQRISLLIGIVYFLLYLLSSTASRNSYKLVQFFKKEDRVLSIIMLVMLFLFIIIGISYYTEIYLIAILCFILLYIIQNIWRPVLIGKFDDYTSSKNQATVLSIESQTKSLGAAIFSPIIGFVADNIGIASVFIFSSLVVFAYLLFSGSFKEIFRH